MMKVFFYEAIRQGYTAFVIKYLDTYPRILFTTLEGYTPLQWATRYNQHDIVTLLKEHPMSKYIHHSNL